MMKVVYKADQRAEPDSEAAPVKQAVNEFGRLMSYKFYKKALKDNAERIAEIQKHFPGWLPEFGYDKTHGK